MDPTNTPERASLPLFVITPDPLDVDALVAAVNVPAAGAVVTFIGLVRDNQDGRAVLALEYEAYPAMAEKELAALGAAVTAQFGLHAIAIHHRVGKLAVGEISVVIAVAGAHRGETFAACAEALEQLKQHVPIWKKEYYADGATWLGQGGG